MQTILSCSKAKPTCNVAITNRGVCSFIWRKHNTSSKHWKTCHRNNALDLISLHWVSPLREQHCFKKRKQNICVNTRLQGGVLGSEYRWFSTQRDTECTQPNVTFDPLKTQGFFCQYLQPVIEFTLLSFAVYLPYQRTVWLQLTWHCSHFPVPRGWRVRTSLETKLYILHSLVTLKGPLTFDAPTTIYHNDRRTEAH